MLGIVGGLDCCCTHHKILYNVVEIEAYLVFLYRGLRLLEGITKKVEREVYLIILSVFVLLFLGLVEADGVHVED